MVLSAADWKKSKAKTLIGETVTPYLADVDKLHKQVFVAGPTASREDLSRLSGALKSLQVEIKKTRAKCKKGIHDATGKYLDDMANDAAKLLADTQKRLVEWNSLLKTFDMYMKHTRTSLHAVVTEPQPAVIAKHKVPVAGALKWMQDNAERFGRGDDTAYVKRMMLVKRASDVFDELEQLQPKSKTGGKPVPATPAALKEPLDEARRLLTQLK